MSTVVIAFEQLLKESERESLTTGDHYWSGVCLKEVGMKGGRFEEGDGVRLGWETGKNQWPGHALTLTRMRSEIWLFSFDPGNKAPAGGLRICPLPNASFPLLSQRYHWLVPMWIRVLVFTLYECLYLDNSLFCVATQKIKKVACRLLFPWLFVTCFSESSIKNATRVRAEYTLLASKQKPPNMFHSLCLSKLWFSRNGTLDMNFEWKRSVGSSGRATSLTALLN